MASAVVTFYLSIYFYYFHTFRKVCSMTTKLTRPPPSTSLAILQQIIKHRGISHGKDFTHEFSKARHFVLLSHEINPATRPSPPLLRLLPPSLLPFPSLPSPLLSPPPIAPSSCSSSTYTTDAWRSHYTQKDSAFAYISSVNNRLQNKPNKEFT